MLRFTENDGWGHPVLAPRTHRVVHNKFCLGGKIGTVGSGGLMPGHMIKYNQ